MFAQVFKFNMHHEPAGSAKGGQFAKALATTVVDRLNAGEKVNVQSRDLPAIMKKLADRDDHPNIHGLSIDGENHFGDGHDGIPRDKMPQVPRAMRDQFLKGLGEKVTIKDIDPYVLDPTQNELDGQKVGHMYGKIVAGTFTNEPIIVSRDYRIIDGHHTWGAKVVERAVSRKAALTIAYVDMEHDKLMAAAQAFTDKHDIERKDITKFDLATVLKAGTAAGAGKAWANRENNKLPDKKAIVFGGKGVGWTNPDGTPLSEKVKAAIKRSGQAIPPAWTDVMVNTDPTASLIVQGRDAKGRLQSRYSAEHTANSGAVKFARISELQKHIPKLLKQSTKDMLDEELTDRLRDDAATVNLILKTGFRPGSDTDTGADEKAFGASTLEKRHIKLLKDNTIHFTFTGKSGVKQDKYLKDKDLHAYLSGKMPDLKDDEMVFKSSGASAGKYLKGIAGEQFKVKDLRTWNGTALARKLVNDYEAPKNAKEFKALQNEVGDAVSNHLGNTRAVAIAKYIDPAVWPAITEDFAPIKKAA